MRQGRPLAAIAAEIQDTVNRRKDFIVPGSRLSMAPTGNLLQVDRGLHRQMEITNTAHSNLSRRLEIPKQYYDRMRQSHPLLLAENVNTWMAGSDRHMLRTLKSDQALHPEKCRAVLSDRYKVIDNDVVMEGLFPVLQEQSGMRVVSSEITDTTFYLKAVFPELEREISLNDAVQAGVIIKNSEVGFSSISVSLLIFRLKCLNGMKVANTAFSARRNHIGRSLEHTNDFQIVASDETTQLSDQAFLSSLKDVVRLAADPDVFHDVASDLQDASMRNITGNVEQAVERVVKHFTLNKTEGESVLENLVRDSDYTQWGLANALTRTAEDCASYDRASEFEAFGGKLIDLKPSQWEAIAA
jgi:hypothetical protein